MFFHIDFDNNLPIYDQVVRQIKFAVASEVLKEGELIPSVRELARELTINPNTVSRAYRQLLDEGVLSSVRGTGLAVAGGASPRCREQRVELVSPGWPRSWPRPNRAGSIRKNCGPCWKSY